MNAGTVALLPWGDLIEDFLDPLGLDIDDFSDRMTGGWLFGYVDALARADVRTVLVCVTARVDRPQRRRHAGTGAVLWLLPASASYLAARRLTATRHLAPYLATPPRRLARVLREEGATAVLCQEYEEARFDVCSVVGRALRLPVFATFQGGQETRTRLERWIRPSTIRAARGFIVASELEAKRLHTGYGVPIERIVRVPNPLDLAEWTLGDRAAARAGLDVPPGARVAVWHGRVELHRKGVDVLLDAWQAVTAARPGADLRLLLVGTGTDAAAVHEQIAARSLRGISWLDRYVLDREVVRAHLHAADVYAFPSRHEGFPVAPIEAMACGLPVVAAAAPGVTDILPGGETDGGLVVATGDAHAFAAALGAVLDDPDRARRMARAARARVESAFSPDAVGWRLRGILVP